MSNFNLMILASTPEDALSAQNVGVDRIFYDLEYIGKAERQRGRDTVKYHNNIDDIPPVRKVVTTSELLVRTNPIHAYTAAEVPCRESQASRRCPRRWRCPSQPPEGAG